jgi:hypothetical protein
VAGSRRLRLKGKETFGQKSEELQKTLRPSWWRNDAILYATAPPDKLSG